jgi:hypothetical protein
LGAHYPRNGQVRCSHGLPVAAAARNERKEESMQVTGMLYGAKLLQFAGFPTSDVLGPDASEEEIKALIERHGSVFVKPVFKGGVGKKGKAGLLGRAKDLKTALKEKERLYFVEHRHGNQVATSCSRSAIPRADWASRDVQN